MAEFRHPKAVWSYDDRGEVFPRATVRRLALTALAVAVAFVLAAVLLPLAVRAAEKTAFPPLPPERFTGDAKRAYTIAGEIPEVLDQLYCWCHCKENPHFQHESLLSCYLDEHAAACRICQQEAIMAGEMRKAGKSIDEIKQAIDLRFGVPYKPQTTGGTAK